MKKNRLAISALVLIGLGLGLWVRSGLRDGPLWLAAARPVAAEATGEKPGGPPPASPATAPLSDRGHGVRSRTPSPPALAPAQFQDGFCAGDGAEDIEITRTLKGIASTELHERQRTSPAESAAADTALLQQLFNAQPEDLQAQSELLRRAELLSSSEPLSMWPVLVAAVSAKAAQQRQSEVHALRKLNHLRPHDPAVGLALALATRSDADLDEAITGLREYLSVEDSPGLARLKARLEVQRDIQQKFQRRTRNGVTLLWPADSISETQAFGLLEAVERALRDAAALTGTARRDSLAVIVYPGRSELLAVSCAANWAGGLFDGALRLIANGTQPLGVDAATVQHESLHAQLSPAAPRAPKWFHEGVAQSFAKETAQASGAWASMVRNRVWVPFESLDGSFATFGTSDAHLAYAQSLAMVEFIKDRCGAAALPAALDAFQHAATTSQALHTACRTGVTGAQLIDYLEQRLAN